MSAHYCRRCGHEGLCGHGNWADRHPWAAVTVAVLLGIIGLMCLCVYPAIVLPALVLGAVAYIAGQRRNSTQALALRCDYEHAQIVSMQPAQRPALPAPAYRPVDLATARTTPLRTQGNR